MWLDARKLLRLWQPKVLCLSRLSNYSDPESIDFSDCAEERNRNVESDLARNGQYKIEITNRTNGPSGRLTSHEKIELTPVGWKQRLRVHENGSRSVTRKAISFLIFSLSRRVNRERFAQ